MSKKLWNKDFILLLQGRTVSTIGDVMYGIAIGYWVYQKTGSSALMGVMSSVSMFVTMFLSPFTGSIVDKCNRKWVLVGVDVLQGVLTILMGILAYLDVLSIPGVLLAAFLAAAGSVFYNPAASTLLLDIIPRDDLVRGQSITSGTTSIIDLAGTAFSGVMVAFFGVPFIMVINGLSNLYSAVSEMLVHVPKTVQQGEQVSLKRIGQDSVAAVKTIWADRCLRVFVPCALILNLLGAGPSALLLPFCMEKGFNVEQYGYLMAAISAGSMLCVLGLGIVKFNSRQRFWIMALGFCVSCVLLVLSYLSRRFLPMSVLAFAAAFLNCAGNVVFNASLMLALPQKNRGAILGFLQSASVGGCALSVLVYGALSDVFPIYLVFSAGNLITLLPMLYMCFHPSIKAFVLNNGCD